MTNTFKTQANTFETANRKLEQFLFMHDIVHLRWYRNNDNLTVWVYPNNAEVMGVVSEFRAICARRERREHAKARVM